MPRSEMVVDGYGVWERDLEGIEFKVSPSGEVTPLLPKGWNDPYLKKFNHEEIKKDVLAYAEELEEEENAEPLSNAKAIPLMSFQDVLKSLREGK